VNEIYKSFDPARWNACLKLLCRPLESSDAIQRPAALVFHYYGRVQNGGHSSHWDSPNTDDDELLQALRCIGAHGQARILVEARLLKHDADEATEGGLDYLWESIEELDFQFCSLRPDIPELLARCFNAHAESFPQ
jgi:hypothetical protein